MKVTKTQLKRIIKEELKTILTNEETGAMPVGDIQTSDEPELGKSRMGATQARKTAISQATKELVASGVTDRERSIIQTIQTSLVAAAGKGDIATGTILRLLKLLKVEIDKLG